MTMMISNRQMADPATLASDVLRGAREIAAFYYGSATERNRRRIYHLAETSNLPVFREGGRLCARRSVLQRWIAAQERRCRNPLPDEDAQLIPYPPQDEND
jgi:hypothetical protein